MTDRPGEKMDLRELLAQFSTAKGHLINSQREMALGLKEICRILVELADSSQISIGGEFPVYVIQALAAMIEYFLARLPHEGQGPDVARAKVSAIDELISIIEAESVRAGTEAKTEVDLAKVEALMAIKAYLLSERKSAEKVADRAAEAQRIRKVSID